MSVDVEIKKKVLNDWKENFPNLSLYSKDKLYKVLGPLIIGLELVKLPRTPEYRPHFVIYPLWKESPSLSLKIPILLSEYENIKGLQYTIPYEKHDLFFSDVLNSIRTKTPISFSSNISLKVILSVLDEYCKTSSLNAAPKSYSQALLYTSKLRIALYVGSKEAENVMDEIIKIDWNEKSFKNWNVDIIDWFQSLHEIIANRDNMMKQIEMNRQDKKIAKLQSSELIP